MGIMFAPDMLAAVLEGRKTQTRRKVKDGDKAEISTFHNGLTGRAIKYTFEVRNAKGRAKWRVNTTPAVQPGRGKMTAYYKRNDHGTISYYDWSSGKRIQGAKAKKSLALSEGYKEGRISLHTIHLERFCDISQADAVAEGFDNPAGFFAKIRELYGDGFDLTQPCWVLKFRLV